MSGMFTANHGAIGLRSKVRRDFWRSWRIHSGSPFHHDIWSTISAVEALLGLEDVVLLVGPAELVPTEVEVDCSHERSLPVAGRLAGGISTT